MKNGFCCDLDNTRNTWLSYAAMMTYTSQRSAASAVKITFSIFFMSQNYFYKSVTLQSHLNHFISVFRSSEFQTICENISKAMTNEFGKFAI